MFDAITGSKLHDLRRGIDIAEIYSLAFHPTSAFLLASSDKGTIHIFVLQSPEAKGLVNKTSYVSKVIPKLLMPRVDYLDSQWSFAQIRGLGKCIAAFSQDGTKIFVLCTSGKAYTYAFNPNGRSHREFTFDFLADPVEVNPSTSSLCQTNDVNNAAASPSAALNET